MLPTPSSAVRIRITYSECLADVRHGGDGGEDHKCRRGSRPPRWQQTSAFWSAGKATLEMTRLSAFRDGGNRKGKQPAQSQQQANRPARSLSGSCVGRDGLRGGRKVGGRGPSEGNKLGTSWAPASGRVGAACQAAGT